MDETGVFTVRITCRGPVKDLPRADEFSVDDKWRMIQALKELFPVANLFTLTFNAHVYDHTLTGPVAEPESESEVPVGIAGLAAVWGEAMRANQRARALGLAKGLPLSMEPSRTRIIEELERAPNA